MSNYPGPPPEGGPYGAPQEPGPYGRPGPYGAPTYGGPPPPSSGTSVASLVLGIVSLAFCLGLLTGIPAMILGRNATKEIDASNGTLGGRGMATAGFVTGLIGTVLSVLFLVAMIGLVAVGGVMSTSFDDPCTTISRNGSTTSDC